MQKEMTATELKSIRRDLELNQHQMAGLLDIKCSTYKNYEQGKAKIPEKVLARFYEVMSRKSQYKFEVSIDWLKIRFKTLDYQKVINEVLQLKITDFFDSTQTFYGYEDMITLGTIRVLFSHNVKKHEEGTLIEFSGSACREFESLLLKQKRTWEDFIRDCFLFAEKYRDNRDLDDFLAFTRADIALDELYNPDKGNIDLKDLKARLEDEKIIVKNIDKISFDDTLKRVKGRFKKSGLTIYFGSRQSDVFIRFYQKDYEQALKRDVSVDYVREVLGLKNRYEIELHKKRAFQVLMDFANGDDLGVIASQILTNYFIVYDWDDHLDVQWLDLVGFYGGYRFVTKPRSVDYSRSKKWMEKNGGRLLLTMGFESVLKNRDLIGEIVLASEANEKYEKIMRGMAERYHVSYEEVMERVKRRYEQRW